MGLFSKKKKEELPLVELTPEINAMEYLLRAYMFEGKEIFEPDENGEDDGRKYFEFLRTHVEHIE